MRKIGLIGIVLAFVLIGLAFGQTSNEYKMIVVEKGQWLADIAQKYDVPMEEIATFNNMKVGDKLLAGQGLKIPLPPKPPKPTTITPTTAKEETPIQEDVTTKITEVMDKRQKASPKWIDYALSSLVILFILLAFLTVRSSIREQKTERKKKEREATKNLNTNLDEVVISLENGKYLVPCLKQNGFLYCPVESCDCGHGKRFRNTSVKKLKDHLMKHLRKNDLAKYQVENQI